MGISIDIKAGKVTVTGSLRHVITDAEVKSFGIHDYALKNAVRADFGKQPNDAYLKSPTPWNDLYKTYGWLQVQTVLVVRSSTITENNSQPVALDYQDFVNNSNEEATYTANMSCQKTNSTSTNWSNTHSINFEQKINYSIEFGEIAKAKLGGETSLSYQYAFGEGGSKSTTTTLTSGSEVTVKVSPGKTKHAILKATKGQMKIRIVYDAYLTGDTAINYDPPHKGHHFWALDIGSVMSSGSITNKKTITEDIVLNYYSHSTVEVGDGPAKKQVKQMGC
ncbi:hypothetical protein O6H91_03G000400 [Diphasiastrum complanatum]|uniref:Uncharacterized protein n=2 Tax=Diphasiastrum complanatum TaxID=34168 RepID=A0ACC2E2U2_DIPCM|nr:hypothetical protein O6H91_03G000400 [Diphasiastrum complanatum]KAJ7560810.1 hypothetical protein O6H91_03G000400 [Diphasiastrum complanatum]